MRDLGDFNNLQLSWCQNSQKIITIEINLINKKGWDIIINNDKIIFVNGPFACPMKMNGEIDDSYSVNIDYNEKCTKIMFKTKETWYKFFSNDKDIQNKSEINKINNIIL